jgi:hypothetical protein
MAWLIGGFLALGVGLFATVVGLDRDRAFYPTVTIVIGGLYTLFAVMGGSTTALVLEVLAGLVFIVAAVVGFKSSLWIVAAALAAHGLFDYTHGRFIANAGVQAFRPAFCGTYDVVAGAYLAGLLATGRVRAR